MPTTTLTRLRRVPTPHSDPPYDDDPVRHRHGALPPQASTRSHDWVQGSLALSLPVSASTLPLPLPHPIQHRTPLRLLPDPPSEDDDDQKNPCGDEEDDLYDHPIPAVHRPWIARLAQALLEALTGERPHGQLLPWTSDSVYAAVARHATVHARRRPNVDMTRRAPAHVRTIRVAKPAPEVAEVCALVRRGPRTQAVALRLEAWRGRWRCTAFELG